MGAEMKETTQEGSRSPAVTATVTYTMKAVEVPSQTYRGRMCVGEEDQAEDRAKGAGVEGLESGGSFLRGRTTRPGHRFSPEEGGRQVDDPVLRDYYPSLSARLPGAPESDGTCPLGRDGPARAERRISGDGDRHGGVFLRGLGIEPGRATGPDRPRPARTHRLISCALLGSVIIGSAPMRDRHLRRKTRETRHPAGTGWKPECKVAAAPLEKRRSEALSTLISSGRAH